MTMGRYRGHHCRPHFRRTRRVAATTTAAVLRTVIVALSRWRLTLTGVQH
jgi:hypothetical protein